MQTISVVTGGAGFIGSHLVKALCERGDKVVVIDNFAGGKFPERLDPRAEYLEIDLAQPGYIDSGDLVNILRGAQYVFHLAALPRVQYSIENPVETTAVNVDCTVGVLEAAHMAGVRGVVFASSSSVYGDSQELPLTEDVPLDPMSPYAWQKLAGEGACRMYFNVHRLPSICLRLFNVYGPHADPNGPYALVVAKFLQQRAQGKPMTIVGSGEHTRDYTHVRDVVRAFLRAADILPDGRLAGGTAINIGGGRQISVNEVAALIGGPTTHVAERQEPPHTLADIDKAKELLGWEPQVSFEHGIAELKEQLLQAA